LAFVDVSSSASFQSFDVDYLPYAAMLTTPPMSLPPDIFFAIDVIAIRHID